MTFCKNIFGNVIITSIRYASTKGGKKGGGIKEIYCSQQFKTMFKKTTYQRSVKYPQSWRFFLLLGAEPRTYFFP